MSATNQAAALLEEKQFQIPDGGWHDVIAPGDTYQPEAGRYHLYIGLFCPFAHRVNLVRHLKGLTSVIPVSIVCPYPKGDENGWPGWRFPKDNEEYAGATVDHLFGSKFLHEVYFNANKEYKGRYSVPVIWDKKTGTIVNNESAEILRWLPSAFDTIIPGQTPPIDLYPLHLRQKIDQIAEWMQNDLNVGVYKAGFAHTQEGYDRNVVPVFDALNKLERMMEENGGPYVLGKEMTELDLRLYPTLIRFDVVYVQHFKCNLGTIRHNYPRLHNWLKNLYWNHPAFKDTTNFKHIKENYTKSHYDVNPRGITPMGPVPDIEEGVENDQSKLQTGYISLPQ